jgi:hypothetical protein
MAFIGYDVMRGVSEREAITILNESVRQYTAKLKRYGSELSSTLETDYQS